MNLAILMFGVSLLLASIGIGMVYKSRRQAQSELILNRLGQAPNDHVKERSAALRYMEKLLLRAGLNIPQERLRLLLLIWGCALLGVLILGGAIAFAAAVVLSALFGRLFLSWRYRKRLLRIGQQLSPMLDQVIRSLQTGRTLSDALVGACNQASEPLFSAMAPVSRNVNLGVPLAESVQNVADMYEQEEMRILAMGLRVNERYGGSAIDLLQSLITVINEREQASRQLRAMTGETRMTAVVLAVLPGAVAGYIMASNPQYLNNMWMDEGGRQMLIASFALQVIGCLLLWRMLRSI